MQGRAQSFELNNMKLSYKHYLLISFACMVAFIILVRMNSALSYVFVGLGIGSALRSLYEYFNKGKQNSGSK